MPHKTFNWKEEIQKLRDIIYEPEHIEGGVCWCRVKFFKKGKELHIEHNEQRDEITNFVDNLVSLVEEQVRESLLEDMKIRMRGWHGTGIAMVDDYKVLITKITK